MYGIAGSLRRWNSEDAFIDFRVVQHLLAGHGPVFNVGERVEAYSSPVWVGVLALVHLLGAPLEQAAVVLGLGSAIVGVALAVRTCWSYAAPRVSDSHDGRFPLGALVLLALPPMWDFATSGLETGLVFAWIGGSFMRLAQPALRAQLPHGESEPSLRGGVWDALLLGAGTLVRPELALPAAAFAIGHLLARPRPRRSAISFGIALIAVPLAYELFRVGYFACLVPNPALAKEAGGTYWGQGWTYVMDFVTPYRLWLPLLIVGIASVRGLRRANLTRARKVVWAAPLSAGLLWVLYVVRVGGDFMHARFLLSPLFCLLLPTLVVDMRRVGNAPVRWSAVVAVVAWAIVCATWLRVPYRGTIGEAGIADERGFWIDLAQSPHPVTAQDYAETVLGRDGSYLRALAASAAAPGGRRIVKIDLGPDISAPPDPFAPADLYRLRPDADPRVRVVVGRWNIGIAGLAAGLDVHIVDRLGLSDPIASRLAIPVRGRPGHEKALANQWIVARWSREVPGGQLGDEVTAARRVLESPTLRELEHAVSDPLSPSVAAANIRRCLRLTTLRLPNDPQAAEREFCTSTRQPRAGSR